jgi:hypothetical protein
MRSPSRGWLVVAVCVVYAQALLGPLQFDDHAWIAVDPGTQSLSAWAADLRGHVRPLTKASFVLTHALGEALGDVPLAHHAGSVLVHLAATLALFVSFVRVGAGLSPATTDAGRRTAFTAALVFALHPLATEAVTYLSGRSMALGSLFVFLAFGAWLGERRLRAVLFFMAAVLARETMLAAILLLPLWHVARREGTGAPWSVRRLGAAGPALAGVLAVVALASAALLLLSERYASLASVSARIAEARLGEPTLVIALRYFAESALLLRYPSIDPDVSITLGAGSRVLAMLVGAGVVIAAWRLRRRWPALAFGIGWVLVFVAPLYLIHARIDALAERHFYPALAGVAFAFGWMPIAQRWLRTGVVAVVVTALFIVTLVRNADYRSEIALWEAAARSAPHKVRVLNNLGAAYLEAWRWDDAERVLARAVTLDPGHARAVENLLQARERMRR